MKQTLSDAVYAELKRRETLKRLAVSIVQRISSSGEAISGKKPVEDRFEKCYDNSHWTLDE